VELRPLTDDDVSSAAALLVEAFPHANGWPTLAEALEEVAETERAWVAIDGELVGWIGAKRTFRNRVWEIHPLVVRAAVRSRGIGRALIDEVARVAAREGAQTLLVGTDDDAGTTSVAHVDAYRPSPLDYVRALTAPADHPIHFYERVGFARCGMIPDANGRGLPNILLARRVSP
jgi:aminoglycoside 6'-N-acetyltransferase I